MAKHPSGKRAVLGPFYAPPAPAPAPASVPAATESIMRTMPRQQRARAAVHRILRATGELLDEAGYDALTTTAVAERAAVNIATLYRYFPDKFALVHALAVTLDAERNERLWQSMQAFADADDWRPELRRLLEVHLDARLRISGARGLRRALHSAPPLWVLEREGAARWVDRFQGALRHRIPQLAARRATVLARTVLAVLRGLLDSAMTDPGLQRELAREGARVLEAYLAATLEARTGSPRAARGPATRGGGPHPVSPSG